MQNKMNKTRIYISVLLLFVAVTQMNAQTTNTQQAAHNQAAAEQEKKLMDNFKKAFTACMEAKGYTVK